MNRPWTITTRARPGWRAGAEVLVLDAHYRQSLAAMRSLSRSGIGVGAVACGSRGTWAPALHSHWCRLGAVVPDFRGGADHYVDAIIALLDEYPARLILPSHDGAIMALRSRRPELERRTFLPLASEAALDIAAAKPRTLALAAELRIAVPRSVVVTKDGDLEEAINEVGYPAVVKPGCSWGRAEGVGTRLGADSILDLEEAKRAVEKILAAGLPAVVQQWLPGRRDAVSVFSTSGRIWARFAQTSYRELPPLGGASVLCESIPPLADLVEPAEALVRAAGLDGYSMVEFRRDRSGRPVLMEINARMAGSLELAIASGVDFPRFLHSWALGKPLREITEYRVGRRQRWLSGDLWHLTEVRGRRGRPDTPTLGRAIAAFLLDFVRRPSPIDGVDATDMRPVWCELQQELIQPLLCRARRAGGQLMQ
jgi:predicted ATP-grasp superfamily ATP-dependent carboligase